MKSKMNWFNPKIFLTTKAQSNPQLTDKLKEDINGNQNIPLNPPSKGDFLRFPPLKGGKGGC